MYIHFALRIIVPGEASHFFYAGAYLVLLNFSTSGRTLSIYQQPAPPGEENGFPAGLFATVGI
jgi:hypothetical protein